MCGRYGRRGDKQYIAEHYAIRKVDYGDDMPDEHPFAFAPNFNVAPESFQPVVRLSHETGEREFAVMRWKLVPFWSDTAKLKYDTINARDDKLQSGSTWREPFKKRRCLIPVEFFYEWEPLTPEERKQKVSRPWAVTLSDERLFSFGGIWDRWTDKATGQTLESFAVVTTEPNEVLEPFHNRCPLVIEPKDYSRWLTPYVKEDSSTVPLELVRTYPGEGMRAWRVAPLKGNGPELLNPLESGAVSTPMLF